MERQELAALLAYMQATWPSFPMAEETVKVWAGQLADLDPGDARSAVETLIRSKERFPSVMEFRNTTLGFTRRRVAENANRQLSDSSPRMSLEDVRSRIAVIRQDHGIRPGIYTRTPR